MFSIFFSELNIKFILFNKKKCPVHMKDRVGNLIISATQKKKSNTKKKLTIHKMYHIWRTINTLEFWLIGIGAPVCMSINSTMLQFLINNYKDQTSTQFAHLNFGKWRKHFWMTTCLTIITLFQNNETNTNNQTYLNHTFLVI